MVLIYLITTEIAVPEYSILTVDTLIFTEITMFIFFFYSFFYCKSSMRN